MNTTIKSITRNLKKLDEGRQQLAAAYVDALLAEMEPEPEPDEPEDQAGDDPGDNGRPAGSWIELKTIRGYGPYPYLRWREGKRIRSKYLKVKDQS